jgi:CheY-like chemotaxis protein
MARAVRARDGLDALAKIEELDPDVVTLDLVMPHLDGLDTLRALGARPRPRVVVVCMADSDSEQALAALAAGAVDVVHEPTALATARCGWAVRRARRRACFAASALHGLAVFERGPGGAGPRARGRVDRYGR